MPHRDRRFHNDCATHAQDLGEVLNWLLKGIDLSAISLRRDCRWGSSCLIAAALLWAWSENKCLLDRFTTTLKLVRQLWPDKTPESTAYQSFMKLLVRWTDPLMLALKSVLRRRMQTSLASRFECFGYSVFGGDGSRLELARTISNEKRFSPKKSQVKKGRKKRGANCQSRRPRSIKAQATRAKMKKLDSPQLWITTLWHAGSGLPWDWLCGASDTSERHHLLKMIESLPKNGLVACDAGFVGYAFWNALYESGREFVIRVGSNVRLLKQLAYVRESGNTVYVWPRREFEKHLPPLVFRLVVLNGGRHPVYLLTSVRDSARLTDRQIAEIYGLRWGIELFYRHFKQTFERRKLRSHRAEHVECEAHWSMLGMWTMLLYAEHHQLRRQTSPEKMSVAGVLRAYRTAIRDCKLIPEPGESLRDLLAIAVVDSYVRRDKNSRGYPRKKYELSAGPPIIKQATIPQIAAAKRIRQTKKGVTA